MACKEWRTGRPPEVPALLSQAFCRCLYGGGGLPGLSLLFTLRAVQPRSSWSLQISPEAGAGQTSLMFSFCAPAFVKQDTRVGREVASHHHSLTTLWPLRLPSSGPGAPWFCLQALQLPLKPLAFALVSREILSGHGVGWGIIGLAWLLDEADSGAGGTRGPRLHPSWQRLLISMHLWFCVARPSNATVQYPSVEKMGFEVAGSCSVLRVSPSWPELPSCLSTGRSASYTHSHTQHKTSPSHQKQGVPSPHYLSQLPPHLWCPTWGQAGWGHRENPASAELHWCLCPDSIDRIWVGLFLGFLCSLLLVCLPLNRYHNVLIAVAL